MPIAGDSGSSEASGSKKRAEFTLSDITNTGDLLRYAAKAQVALLKQRRHVTQREVASAIGLTGPQLADTLNGGGRNAKDIGAILSHLDAAVFAFDAEVATATGGLVALAARLHGYKDDATAVGKIPSAWVAELLQKDFEKPVGVLIQSSALLSAFMGASSQEASDAVCTHHMRDLHKIIHPLLMIGVGAPTPHSIDALILLGGLGRHRRAFEGAPELGSGMGEILEEALRESPLGFRIWRVITAIVHAASSPEGYDGRHTRGRRSTLTADHLQTWVKMRLERSAALRKISLYPARSLDLELATAIPSGWTPDHHDWVAELLMDRARGASINLRERSTAAMGLWERALSYPADKVEAKRAQARRQIRMIIDGLNRETLDEAAHAKRNRPRPYNSAPPGGREWLIATLEHVISQETKVVSTWPMEGHSCLQAVTVGVNQLLEDSSIPDALRRAGGPRSTEFLFQQAILQNAGVYRRKAIDTLRGAGIAAQATRALTAILRHPDAEPWLRCRVLFAIGFLQEREHDVEEALVAAFKHARDELGDARRDGHITRDIVSEVHAALFAIGDCYGAPGQEGPARRMRQYLEEERLWELVDNCKDSEVFAIPRAAAYLLTVTPHGPEDRERLERLASGHPDETTRKACTWAREMRFVGSTNEVRPLHLAPPAGRHPT